MNDKYLSVSAITRYLKAKFDSDDNLRVVFLKGEISNIKYHTTGHIYFSIKDETSKINAIMFSSSAKKLLFKPVDGSKVLITGRISVYEATGGYQVYVDEMLEDGIGNLYIAYEQLKKKLEAEGLFDASKKKKIPRMPKRIGIVTASTGAAIRDILTTIKRRYPIVETILFPALVQGRDAAADIAKKIEIANTYDIDTLIVGRGGGSIEDLWPFNEEIVARAIYQSKVPVISAVGHEIDFTIADFVADLRAPTPTAAAELAVVDIQTVLDYLMKVQNRSYQAMINLVSHKELALKNLTESYILKKPSNIYEVKEQKLDMLMERLDLGIRNILEKNRVRLFQSSSSYVLNNPEMLYYSKIDQFKNLYQKLNKEMTLLLDGYLQKVLQLENSYVLSNPEILYKFKEQKLIGLVEKLEVLNPMNTLKRGYTIVKCQEKIVSDIKQIKKDDELEIQFKNGNVVTKVIEVGE